jgi:ABC-2 type transport system ATP-binding protein
MIEITGLSKRYGSTVALEQVSLAIQPGEVVGLLGPNGAGKSTMLRILTGYIPPSSGTARVAGFDVQEDSLDVRRRIGYLPESNPLYEDLAVLESLEWTARLRQIPAARRRQAIAQVIEVCGLGAVAGRDIGQLSKGYRQRVGLAQAIVDDPEILILDEPTSGLDPNQQQEVRNLIGALREKKTVIVSTHILSEAQTSCNRVVIIHQGKLVADGTPDSLGRGLRGGQSLRVEFKAPAQALVAALSGIPGVERVSVEQSGPTTRCRIETSGSDVREPVFHLAAARQWPILEMTSPTASLEDVFRELTAS